MHLTSTWFPLLQFFQLLKFDCWFIVIVFKDAYFQVSSILHLPSLFVFQYIVLPFSLAPVVPCLFCKVAIYFFT